MRLMAAAPPGLSETVSAAPDSGTRLGVLDTGAKEAPVSIRNADESEHALIIYHSDTLAGYAWPLEATS